MPRISRPVRGFVVDSRHHYAIDHHEREHSDSACRCASRRQQLRSRVIARRGDRWTLTDSPGRFCLPNAPSPVSFLVSLHGNDCMGEVPEVYRPRRAAAQEAPLRASTSGGQVMKCQFCGDQLSGTQIKSCSARACVLAAKRARGRARLAADPSIRLKRKRHDDDRSWDFPPELEYLDQDPGITVEQMAAARRDPVLRQHIVLGRLARQARLRARLGCVKWS